MSKSLLYFIAGVAAFYAIVLTKDKKQVTPHAMAKLFSQKVKSICPTVGACIFGYMVGAMFVDLNVSADLEHFITSLHMNRLGLSLFIPLFCCFITMIIPGSSVVVLFGSVFISLFVSVGADPIMIAAMLPCICGVMCGITPPLALGMYAGMTLSGAEFGKTVRNDLWWVALQYLLEFIILMGWLPIIGL